MPRYVVGDYIINYFDRYGVKVAYEYAYSLTQARDMAKERTEADSYVIIRTLENSKEFSEGR